MAWIYPVNAGLFEGDWAVSLKYSEGFARLVPSLFTAGSMALSIWLLSIAMIIFAMYMAVSRQPEQKSVQAGLFLYIP